MSRILKNLLSIQEYLIERSESIKYQIFYEKINYHTYKFKVIVKSNDCRGVMIKLRGKK